MSDNENEFLLELQDAFLQEAMDLIANVEGSFLAIEKDPSNEQELSQILRLFHNLKGSAAAVGFIELSTFCHKVETLLDKMKKKEIKIVQNLFELLLACCDRVNDFLAILSSDKNKKVDCSEFIVCLDGIIQNNDTKSISDLQHVEQINESINVSGCKQKITEYLLLASSDNKDSLIILLEELYKYQKTSEGLNSKKLDSIIIELQNFIVEQVGSFASVINEIEKNILGVKKEVQNNLDLNLLNDFFNDCSEQLDLLDVNLLKLDKKDTPIDKEALDAVFRSFHTIKSAAAIVEIKQVENLAHHMETLLSEVRDKNKPFTQNTANICSRALWLFRKIIVDFQNGKVKDLSIFDPEILSIISSTTNIAIVNNLSTISNIKEPIKVDAERLDKLVDLIGELVIAETMVSQSEDLKFLSSTSQLFKFLDRLNKITRSLQEVGMALRMVPIKQTFRKLTRIVRDVSKKLEKEIKFETYGDDTELDKTIADKVGDPLVHMIRNAIDHGIEDDIKTRLQSGKNREGKIELKAFHKGGSIWIEVTDDGKGLDSEILLNKSIEKGLVKQGTELSEKEIHNLIFAPGFSTAKVVTDVSGRGVGMDVVKKNIEELRGQIDIESKKGQGTTFKIRIPNTLAIIEGMVIKIGSDKFIISTQSIVRSIKPDKKNLIISTGTKQEMLNLQDEVIPIIRLAYFYSIKDAYKDIYDGIIIIVEDNNKKIGLYVDSIVKQQQFVIKALGSMFNAVPGVSGGTIMPDGTVGLIIDVGLLIQNVNKF